MRVFVAGATGAIGKQLVPRLVAVGHEVHGMTRSESKQAMLYELGAVPVVADALDPDQVAEAVGRARPDVIVHQLTAIGALDPRHFDRDFALTNRLRTEGTDHLLSAGQAVGVWSFIHVADAAEATVAAVEHGSRGVYNIVDDDPAPVAEWLPALAQTLGAKQPMRVPRFIGRLFAGEAGVVMMTDARGASNAKAKRELAWRPAHPSWRQGFTAA
jgi:nucleoside-diphosphate-sugar epimerase